MKFGITFLILLIQAAFSAQSASAQVLLNEHSFRLNDFRREAQIAENNDLICPESCRDEKNAKSEFILKKLRDRQNGTNTFNDFKAEAIAFSPLHQSWVQEVDQDLLERPLNYSKRYTSTNTKGAVLYNQFLKGTRLELAKRVAMNQSYVVMQRLWSESKRNPGRIKNPINSIYELDVRTLEDASQVIGDKIQQSFYFIPELSRGRNYVFKLSSWAIIEVNKNNLNLGRVLIVSESTHDYNPVSNTVRELKAENAITNESPSSSRFHTSPTPEQTPNEPKYPSNPSVYNNNDF